MLEIYRRDTRIGDKKVPSKKAKNGAKVFYLYLGFKKRSAKRGDKKETKTVKKVLRKLWLVGRVWNIVLEGGRNSTIAFPELPGSARRHVKASAPRDRVFIFFWRGIERE